MILVQWTTWRSGARAAPKASRAERWAALKAGGLALGMPVIILGGMYSGYFTAIEAAAVSVAYAFLVEVVIYRSMGWRDIIETAQSSAITVSAIFILLAMGALVSYFTTLARLPDGIVGLVETYELGWVGFLIMVNLVFLVAGMFIDPKSILVILVPALFPVATALVIDPVHFGIIACLNICIGMVTPPFGLDLFVTSSRLNKPVETVIAGIWPFIGANILVLILV